MEFRLNKIDTNLREKVNEETSDGRIHRKKEIQIYNNGKKNEEKEIKKQKKKSKKDFRGLLAKEKVITVDAVKISSVEVESVNEDLSSKNDRYLGVFLDTKK